MENDPSPLDTLRQLKEWLDAGTITPAEFETLKQQLVFAPARPAPAASETPATGEATPEAAPEMPPAEAAMPETPAPIVPPGPMLSPVEVVPTVPAPTSAPPEPVLPPAPIVSPEPIAPIAPVVPPVAVPVSVMPAPTVPFEPTVPPIVAPVIVVPEPVLPPTPAPAYIPEPTTVAPVEMAPLLPPITHTAATSFSQEEEYVEDEAYTAPRKSPLLTIMVVGAVLALLALVAYLLLDGRESERLTSATRTAADSVAVQPETGPQTEQIDLPPVLAPETIRVAQVAPPVVAPIPVDTAAMDVTTPATPAEAPAVLSESAAKARVETIMQRYYTDLQAAPFTAAAYFAPQVERFYTMQSTTPAAINAELAKTHFPEFLEGQTAIQAGTLQVGAPVADGSRVVTFVEDSQAFRQSRQERQRTSAQMRVRFDKDFKIVYLRQEKLLKNEFGD